MFVERDGKQVEINAYSLLQDRYFEHMKSAGFEGFERGERGSTAEHLDVLDYKIQQDEKRLDVLDTRIEKRQKKIEKLDKSITLKTNARTTIAEVDAMGKPALLGGVNFSDDEAKKLKALAKKSVSIDKRADEYKKKIDALEGQITDLNSQIRDWRSNYNTMRLDRDAQKQNYERLWSEVKPFINAIRAFPQMLLDFIRERLPHKSQSQER
jgi:chromosome segregation ATPase